VSKFFFSRYKKKKGLSGIKKIFEKKKLNNESNNKYKNILNQVPLFSFCSKKSIKFVKKKKFFFFILIINLVSAFSLNFFKSWRCDKLNQSWNRIEHLWWSNSYKPRQFRLIYLRNKFYQLHQENFFFFFKK
jgi:hypothetical protein